MTVNFPIDLSTQLGQVRLLIPDRVEGHFVFQDEEILAFLAVEENSTKRAAALALETIASDIAMTDKVMTVMEVSTDGAKASDALLKRAASLREQAATQTDVVEVQWFEKPNLTAFSRRRR